MEKTVVYSRALSRRVCVAIMPILGVIGACMIWQIPAYADEAPLTSDVPVVREDTDSYLSPHWIQHQPRACYPLYPEDALQTGMQGTVSFWLQVDEAGKVTSVRLAQSSGHHVLDQATLKAFSNCIFSPARDYGQPVSAWTKLDYVWKSGQ